MSTQHAPTDITWKTSDGLNIVARYWAAESPRALVLLIHGIGDHSGRFDHVAKLLNRFRFSVIAPDLRGNGRSAGQRGFVRIFDVLLDDIHAAVAIARQRADDLPLFIYGQSMGGLLGIYYAIKRQPNIRGLVATSPALGIAMPAPTWKVVLGKSLGVIVPRMSLDTGLDVFNLTDDRKAVEKLVSDPLRHHRITPRMYFGMINAGQQCFENANRLNCAALLMHGGQDRITDHKATEGFSELAGPHIGLKIWPDGKHELHNMTNKDEILGHLVQWLDHVERMPSTNAEDRDELKIVR